LQSLNGDDDDDDVIVKYLPNVFENGAVVAGGATVCCKQTLT